MIRTIVASTGEIDDVEKAVGEVLAQLDLATNLCKNAVGILACHYEFVFSGVSKALCDSLPFEVVGTITSAQAVNDEAGTLLLTLMVLTSDDIVFTTVRTPSLASGPAQVIAQSYQDACAAHAETPSMIFAFAPFMVQNSGDQYVETLTKVSGGVPCFGTLAVDDSSNFVNCFMLYDGQEYRENMAMILFFGPLQPKFYIATISEGKLIDRAALVTKSNGHILQEVNSRPVLEYFDGLGLLQVAKTSYAMTSLPFMLDYGDGTPPVSKVFIGLNENNEAICAGVMPEGSTLYIGMFDKADVLFTSGNTIRQALAEAENANGLLIYSCVSRNMTLGSELLAELDLVRQETGNKLPFMMAYSGGEICPTQTGDAGAINRFHNNAFVVCIF